MFKKLPFGLALSIVFFACQKNELETIQLTDESEEVTLEKGFLSFASSEDLDAYLDEISSQLNSSSKSGRTIGLKLPEGFIPLAKKSAYANSNGRISDEDGTVEIESELNDLLIPFEALHYVLDTARRVMVNGEIYQVTEAGTFIYKLENSVEFDSLYSNFLDEYLNFSEVVDSATYLYQNVKFTDTYNFIKNQNLSEEAIFRLLSGEDIESDRSNISNSGRVNSDELIINDDWTREYGLKNVDYRRTFINNVFKRWETTSFDSDNRVAVSLYELNYGFYAVNGFKVKKQSKVRVSACIKIFRKRRCKTLFTYWRKAYATDMVIGIDDFVGYTEFTTFGIPQDDYIDAQDRYYKNFSGATVKLAFHGILDKPKQVVDNWIKDKLYSFGGVVELVSRGANWGFNQGYKELRKMASKRTENYIYRFTGYDKKAPIVFLTPGLDTENNREWVHISGLQTYQNLKDRNIRLGHSSQGIKIPISDKRNPTQYSAGASGFTPNRFKIYNANIFGAVKHNGVWKGVRLIKD